MSVEQDEVGLQAQRGLHGGERLNARGDNGDQVQLAAFVLVGKLE